MKELFEDIKLSKIAYLLEKIEKQDINGKVKNFRKLEKYKITTKIGLFLIKNSTRDYGVNDELGGVNSSIIELCFKDYKKEYNKAIEEIFEDLSLEAKDRVLFLLTTLETKDSLELYVDLILKHYKNRETIPIGRLAENPSLYKYLFPKLFKALKYKSKRNNILILFNNYLNAGIVPKEDITKNKKLITDSICLLFEEALKFKFKNTYDALNDKKYKKLRYFLELAINIEISVSGRKTKDYLKKLLKKNDNQLKLFILDNYYRKGTSFKDINFTTIARDKASRYALFELLTIYDKVKLMPKKYMDQKLLAESDFYINFVILSSYTNEPDNMKFYKIINVDGYDYYTFKFKYEYKYNAYTNDYLTNYICNQVGIEKYNNEKLIEHFVGVSGGYNKSDKPTTVVNPQKKLIFTKINKDEDLDEAIIGLIKQQNIETIQPEVKEEPKTEDISVENIIEEKEITEEEHIEKQENETPIEEEIIERKPSIFAKFKKKDKEVKKQEITEYVEKSKRQYHIFSYFLLFLFAIFLGLLVYCVLYIYGVGSLNEGNSDQTMKAVALKDKGNFTEILGREIFNQTENEYYVLLYTGKKKDKSKYYGYINEYSKRNYRFYFVDLNNEENKFLYGPNDLGFTLEGDRLLKVKEHEYEYYVDGKSHILFEFETQLEEIYKQEIEAQKAAEKEANKQNQASIIETKILAANMAEISANGLDHSKNNVKEMVDADEVARKIEEKGKSDFKLTRKKGTRINIAEMVSAPSIY